MKFINILIVIGWIGSAHGQSPCLSEQVLKLRQDENLPVGQERVSLEIQSSRSALTHLLEIKNINDSSAIQRVKKEMLEIIQNVPIQDSVKSACLNAAQKQVNASTFGHGEDSKLRICISSQRLGTQLNLENVQVQTLALIAHEYAHLAGAGEKLATWVQSSLTQSLETVPLRKRRVCSLKKMTLVD